MDSPQRFGSMGDPGAKSDGQGVPPWKGAGDGEARKVRRVVHRVLSVASMAKLWRGRLAAEESRSQEEESNRRNNLSHAVGAWSDVYFFMLDAPWSTVAGMVAALYVILVVAGTLPLAVVYLASDRDDEDVVLVRGGPESEDGEVDVMSQLFMFSASNIVTMGFGQHHAATRAVFAIATLQQFIGMIANVFLFSVCINKFQRAEPDIIFSKSALFLTRDDEQYLLFRIGNLRCNFIYHPDVKATLLCHRVTKEGESFMQQYHCKLDNVPSVISGVYTICHRVDDTSPFKDICSEEALASFPTGSLQLSISIMGRDAVYHDDIHAIKRYRGGAEGDFVFNRRFGDIMRVDQETDVPWVDFEEFHVTVPLAGMEDDDEEETDTGALKGAEGAIKGNAVAPGEDAPPRRSSQGALQEPHACLVPTFGHVRVSHNVRPSFDEPDVVHFITGGLHPGGTREDTPMVPVCPFTSGFIMMAKVMGLKYTVSMVRIPAEMGKAELKSAWFTEATGGKGETPALVYNGEVVEGSDAVRAWLLSTFPEHAKGLAPAGQLPEEGYDPGMRLFMALMGLGKIKAAAEDDDEGTAPAFLEGLRKTLALMDAAIASNGGAFGEGGRLSPVDFRLAPFIETVRCFERILPPSVVAANGGKRVVLLDDSVPALRSWHLRRMWPLLRDCMADHELMELLVRTPRNRTMFSTLQLDSPEFVARIDAAVSEWFTHGRILGQRDESVARGEDAPPSSQTRRRRRAPVYRPRPKSTRFTSRGPLPRVEGPAFPADAALGALDGEAAPLNCEFCV